MSDTNARALQRGFSDSLLLGLGSFAAAGLGLIALRLLLTGMSEVEYGQYAVFLALASLLTVAVTWPTHAVLRLGAEEWEERRAVGRTFATILTLVVSAGVLTAVAAALLRDRIDAWLGFSGAWAIAAAFAGLTGVAQLGYTLLQPTERTGYRTLLPAIARLAQAGLLALVVLGGTGTLTVGEAALLSTIAIFPAGVITLLTVASDLRRPEVDRATVDRAVAFGSPLILRNLGVMALLYVDVLVLKYLLGDAAAGRYHVAYAIAEQVVVFGFVLEFLTGPWLATSAARRDRRAVSVYYEVAVPPLTWLWALGAALLVALAEPVMLLLGAKSPQLSAAVLQLLCLTIAVRGVGLLEGPLLDAHLLSRWPTLFFLLGLALNLVLDVVLITRFGWGIEACAVGTLAGFLLQGLLRAGYIAKTFGVPAFRPYLALLAPGLVWLLAQAVPWPAVVLGWVVLGGVVLVVGRTLGLFSARAHATLTQVPMPGVVRRIVGAIFPS